MKRRRVLKGLLIFAGIAASLILITLIIFLFKPHKITVAGIPDGFIESQIEIGEVTLNYVEGPPNGTPVLLIPGQMESWQGYKLVMSELSKSFHVFIVDVRGQGKSDHTPGNYSYNICGNDLRLFLKRVVKEPAIVSGLSSGAVLSVWLGAMDDNDVNKIQSLVGNLEYIRIDSSHDIHASKPDWWLRTFTDFIRRHEKNS